MEKARKFRKQRINQAKTKLTVRFEKRITKGQNWGNEHQLG